MEVCSSYLGHPHGIDLCQPDQACHTGMTAPEESNRDVPASLVGVPTATVSGLEEDQDNWYEREMWEEASR